MKCVAGSVARHSVVNFGGRGIYTDLSKTSLADWTKFQRNLGVPVLVLNACQSAMHKATGSARGSDPAVTPTAGRQDRVVAHRAETPEADAHHSPNNFSGE